MSRRVKSAEESARRDRQVSASNKTLVADATAPRNPKNHGPHYRSHLIDTLVVVDQLQARISELEATLAKARASAAYERTLTVSRIAAEEARQKAASAMRYLAASIVESVDGHPTPVSHAIDTLPLPRPKFTH